MKEETKLELKSFAKFIAVPGIVTIFFGLPMGAITYAANMDIVDKNLNEVVKNLNDKDLEEIKEVLQIEGIRVDLSNNTVEVLARVDANTDIGVIETLYSYKFEANEDLISIAKNSVNIKDEKWVISIKDIYNVNSLSANNFIEVMSDVSKDELIEYSLVNKENEDELIELRNKYINSINNKKCIKAR